MQDLLQKPQGHIQLLSIAIPLILANITTPLLGLVDTAILGRMDGLHFLAGAAIASLILTQLYWVCGFIKMSMTGLSAQSRAAEPLERNKTLVQGCALALVLAGIILLLQVPILHAGLWFAQAQVEVVQNIEEYFYVRVWGAPAALLNLAIIGWLIGQQKGRLILVLQVLVNLINIAASYSFVYFFDMGVKGVATGTIVAEYSMAVLSLLWVHKHYLPLQVLRQWFHTQSLSALLSLNTDMLIRNLALQFTLAFVTLKGAQYGTQAAAVNAVLMQFFALIALGLDGIANAVEALVGEVKGQNDLREKTNAKTLSGQSYSPRCEALDEGDSQKVPNATENPLAYQVFLGIFWSSVVALLYVLIFWVFGDGILNILTNQEALIQATTGYMWVILLLPVIAHWCFLFDGVYVGLTRGKTMRNNMLISTICVFLPCYFYLSEYDNQALWMAMFAFLAARGVGLGLHFTFMLLPEGRKA